MAPTTRRTTSTSTARPRHAHAGRHRPARLGAVRQLQPERGRPGLHRRPGHGPGVPVEALHRWPHGPTGHPRRHGVYQQYVDDIVDDVKKALAAVDPTPYFAKYGNNAWAASSSTWPRWSTYASVPVIQKYLGVLAAADVYTDSTAFTSSSRSASTSASARRCTHDASRSGPGHGPLPAGPTGGAMTGNGREPGGSFALGAWHVRPAGYGAMPLAATGSWGSVPLSGRARNGLMVCAL